MLDSDIQLANDRREFLSRFFAASLGLMGASLIGVSLVNLLFGSTSSVGTFSLGQGLQGVVGLFFVFSLFNGKAKNFFLSAFARQKNQLRVFLFPLLVWPFFLVYRFSIEQSGEVKPYLRRITEGSIVEWLSFIFLLFSAFLLWKAVSNWSSWRGKLIARFIAICLFVASMEEMSWGQMIFNWRTPEVFDVVNRQQETNMHNLAFFHDYTWLTLSLVFTLLSFLSAISYFQPWESLLKRSHVVRVVLPLSCCFSYFLIAVIIYWGVVIEKSGVNVSFLHTREQEIAECLAAIGIFIHCVFLYLSPASKGRMTGSRL